jgi:RNA-directed DNA polymerase
MCFFYFFRVGVCFSSSPTLKCLDRRLIMWATRKYKRLRNHRRRAAQWLNRIAHKQPWLFAHWRLLYAKA